MQAPLQGRLVARHNRMTPSDAPGLCGPDSSQIALVVAAEAGKPLTNLASEVRTSGLDPAATNRPTIAVGLTAKGACLQDQATALTRVSEQLLNDSESPGYQAAAPFTLRRSSFKVCQDWGESERQGVARVPSTSTTVLSNCSVQVCRLSHDSARREAQ